jgi:hypothetical protein
MPHVVVLQFSVTLLERTQTLAILPFIIVQQPFHLPQLCAVLKHMQFGYVFISFLLSIHVSLEQVQGNRISGYYMVRCLDSFVYNPTNVTLILNQTNADCSAIYGTLQIYKTSGCIDRDQIHLHQHRCGVSRMESTWLHRFSRHYICYSIQDM